MGTPTGVGVPHVFLLHGERESGAVAERPGRRCDGDGVLACGCSGAVRHSGVSGASCDALHQQDSNESASANPEP
jgi:hypothetical protein